MFYGMIECGISCPKCGGTIPLNGPWEIAHCDKCQEDISIPRDFWKGILEDIHEEIKTDLEEGEGGNSTIFGIFNTTLFYGRLHPYCLECKTNFKPEENPEESYKHICTECGNTINVLPCPLWLKEVYSPVLLLVNTTLQREQEKIKSTISGPVAFTCPQCAGSLIVNGSDRLIKCQYCGVNAYLPDDLWMRLHPAVKKSRWFVGFE